MNTIWKSAGLLLLVCVGLFVGAVLLRWGLGSVDIPQYWEAVALMIGSYWAGWLFTAIVRRQAESLLIPLAAALSSLGWLEIVRVCVGLNELGCAMHQARFVALGIMAFMVVALILRDYRVLEDYKYSLLLCGVLLQLAVMVVGVERNGARLWLQVGGVQIQPVEFAKILVIIFLAAYLRQFSNWIRLGIISRAGRLPLKALLLLGLGMALAEGVLVLQKDLGMALLLFGIFVSLFYIATGRRDLVFLTALLTAGGAYGCYWLGAYGHWWQFAHVAVRVQVWLDPFKDVLNDGFQMCQSLFALANGGLDGTGLGLGTPYFIPDADTDFIISAIGEELGLAGTAAVLLSLILLCVRGFSIALKADDEFGTLLASGLACMLSWQSLIVFWGCTKMMPMTGITLPFVSRGGSSLIASFVVLAILWRISWPSSDSVLPAASEG